MAEYKMMLENIYILEWVLTQEPQQMNRTPTTSVSKVSIKPEKKILHRKLDTKNFINLWMEIKHVLCLRQT